MISKDAPLEEIRTESIKLGLKPLMDQTLTAVKEGLVDESELTLNF